MKSYALGPPTVTFGPSIRITAVFGLLGLIICLLSFGAAYITNDITAWRIFFILAPIFCALLLWQLSFRAAIHESGISCSNIFSTKEMRWLEVDRVYSSVEEVSVKHIPVGQFYSLKLRSVYGHSISFTNHISRHEELILTIAQSTFKPLAEKALQSFDSGSIVTFGAITAGRWEGITVRTIFFNQTIRWHEIDSYDMDAAGITFYLRKKVLRSRTISAGRIANPHVLKFLLDHVMQQVWLRS